MCNGTAKTFEPIYQEADSALYIAEERGRKRYFSLTTGKITYFELENLITEQTIRNQLFEEAEDSFMIFSKGLLPGTENILGVRLPILRKIAKLILKGNWRNFLKETNPLYFEEIMLRGMIIGYAKMTGPEERLGYIASFIPFIDNWSVCDSFCTGLKFTKQYRSLVWHFLQSYFYSRQEYEVRFAVVMSLNFYLEDDYIDEVFFLLDGIKQDGYYVKMAVAWAVSMCFVKYNEKTLNYLKNSHLDRVTFHKALQKIGESRQVSEIDKVMIKKIKVLKSEHL